MNISELSIRRPVLATVFTLIIVLFGAIGYMSLGVREYPSVDNPIICSMRAGDFTTTGHYIVLVGCEDGLIRVNDPNSHANSEKLWSYEQIESQIRNLWVIRGIG